MERIEAANPSLTVGAPNLAPEFSAMFCKDFTIEILGFFGDCAPEKRPLRGST